MATPTKIWDREPHTEAKHKILRSYLSGWFPKIALTPAFREAGFTYVDAFAGPGEYSKGEEGSPLIALEQAHMKAVRDADIATRVLLIEKLPNFKDHLQSLVAERYPESRRPRRLRVEIREGDCTKLLIPALRDIGGEDGPIFVNFDGWGVDLPVSLVRHIGKRKPAPEVFIFFNTSMFVRLASSNKVPQADRLFGTHRWRPRISGVSEPEEKKRVLVEIYRDVLKDAGFTYTLPFELVTRDSNSYMLFFGTTHVAGVQLMKDSMWKVDSYSGSRFRDPRINGQAPFAIELEPELGALSDSIFNQLEANGPTCIKELKRFTLLETMFHPRHVTKAVESLTSENRAVRHPGPNDGERIVELAAAQPFSF